MNLQKTFCLLALVGIAILPLGVSAHEAEATLTTDVEITVGSGTTTTESEATFTDNDTPTSDSGSQNMDTGLTGGLRTNALGIEVTSSSQVTSDADLEVFSDNLKARDERVAEAHAAAVGNADVSYYHEGRLFGLFPVKVKAHTWVTTNEDGSLKVNTTMPWWSAFVAGTGDVRSTVDARLASSSSLAADMRAGADASARARVIEAIARAHAGLSASTAVTASEE